MESLISSHLLLFALFSFIATITCTELTSNPIQDSLQDIVCSVVDCGQGKCKLSNDSSHSIVVPYIGPVGFDCDCKPGWKEIQIGSFTYPSCLIPNCTINFGCNSSPSQPGPLPPPSLVPQCALVWCNDGTCVANGTSSGYSCKCNEGSLNLFDLPGLPCFKTCSFGADCKSLNLPYNQDKSNAPSLQRSGSTCSLINCLRNLHAVTMIMLTSIFLTTRI
ncbi:hypothetical protein M0R45_031696 [Rubus argutus]|uniref:Uncharacterized protein n=1 Tax=Rubus argutus TaxID=59490 RepID=A0AAW1WIW9_RUBAR